MRELAQIAEAPLPALPTCAPEAFGANLRLMFAALPRRQSDDVSGELFVRAYESQLGHMPEPQIEYLRDRALQTCKWFPTIAECLEIAQGWRRSDQAVWRKAEAARLLSKEERAREVDARQIDGPMTQEQVDALPETLRQIGLRAGFLIEGDDGIVRPNAS